MKGDGGGYIWLGCIRGRDVNKMSRGGSLNLFSILKKLVILKTSFRFQKRTCDSMMETMMYVSQCMQVIS